MIKEKNEYGYPLEAGWSDDYNSSVCDNCGEPVDLDEEDDFVAARAIDKDKDGNKFAKHYYFCDTDCLDEFCTDNGLKKEFNEFTGVYDLTLDALSLKDSVDQIQLDFDEEPKQEPADPVSEKKASECWSEVVKQAQEIAELSSRITIKQEELKSLKKEYETLVNRQNSYILTNANGIQLTFDDCDNELPPEPEPNLEWRDEPVTTLTRFGLTDKQADKAQEAFGTLGRLQDWLCSDYRDKQPGIGQALQDKLTDALNDYTETVYAKDAGSNENKEQEQV